MTECGVQRVDGPSRSRGRGQGKHSGPTHGWQARIPVPGPEGTLTRFFADGKHGGREAAFAAAVEWRRKQLAAAGLPHHSTRPIRFRPRGGNERVGVYRSSRPYRRKGRTYQSPAWVATFAHAGERLYAAFAVAQHGEAGARTLAERQREAWEAQHLGGTLSPAVDVDARAREIASAQRGPGTLTVTSR